MRSPRADRPTYLPPYPRGYVGRLVAPDYWPDLQQLSADYLDANPTRDRSLDLLPILLHLDAERVRARLPHAKIGGWPVFHYRLPQAHVGEPGWSILPDWRRWLIVERLAADRDRLARLGLAYLGFGGSEDAWATRAGSAIVELESVSRGSPAARSG